MSNILVFGDSIAYGYYDNEGGWVDRLKKDLLKYSFTNNLEFDLKVYNLCISGDKTTELLERIDTELYARNWEDQPTKIIFAIGINDSVRINSKHSTSKEKFITNLNKLIDKAKEAANFIAFVGLTPVDESIINPIPWDNSLEMFNKDILEYDKSIRKICDKQNVHYLKLFEEDEFLSFQKFLHDGLHPNTNGHKILFSKISEYLDNYLK